MYLLRLVQGASSRKEKAALRIFPSIVILTFFCVGPIGLESAGAYPEEETAIRRQIAAIDANGNAGHSLSDVVFWSGAYKEPIVGSENETSKRRPGEGGISDRKDNSEKLTTTPQRIIVADSKDLAYEYSRFLLEFDTKAGKRISLNGAALRVWQKQNGQWKQAAIFARGYDK